jgi:hypothetical protein
MSCSDRDPVKDFFDGERRQIISQPGDDLHWQSILRRSRAQRRSRFLGYAAGMTAASLVLGSVSYGAFLHGAFNGGHNSSTIVTAAANGSANPRPTPRPGATREPAPGTATPPPQELSPIDALTPELSKPDARTIWEAQRKLIRGCMLAKGINFTYPTWEVQQTKVADTTGEVLTTALSSAKKAFGDPTWARVHGYGFDAKAFTGAQNAPATQEVPQPGGGGVLDAKTMAALYGSGPGETLVLTKGAGQVTYSTTGCQAEATRRLYGDVKQFYLLRDTRVQVSALNSQVASAPAVSASLVKWRTCMSSRGFASLRGQSDAFGKVYTAYLSRQSNARELEFSIAPADAACTASSGYGEAFTATEEKLAGGARQTMGGVIGSFVEIQRKAVAEATSILRS